jgi:hypothetical protein
MKLCNAEKNMDRFNFRKFHQLPVASISGHELGVLNID